METRKMTWPEYYRRLTAKYLDAHSLPYKKMKLVDSHIDTGKALLDIGTGTGELIELAKHKFEKIYGVDILKESIDICNKRFYKEQHISLIQGSIEELGHHFQSRQFDCVTCLDVLEHIKLKDCKEAMSAIFNLLCDNGKFIFTAPGFLSKVIDTRLNGEHRRHSHYHSSYGWKQMIKQARFTITSVETVEFPIIHSEFLRKKLHLFGKCCLIVACKLSRKEQ